MPASGRAFPLAALLLAVAAPALAAGGWSGTHPLSNCGAPPDPVLARDGSASVVFAINSDCGGEGGQGSVLRESRAPGGPWSAPAPVSPADLDAGPQPPGSPSAVNGVGQRLVAWLSDGAVHAAVFDPVRGWGPIRVLARAPALRSAPSVLIDDSGDAVVGWARAVGQNAVVEAAVRAPAGRWSRARAISGRPAPVASASFTLDPTGHALVVWVRRVARPGGGGQLSAVVAAEHVRGAAGWTAPAALQRRTNAYLVRSGVDGAGAVLVAWWGAVPDRIVAVSRAPGGAWRTPRALPGRHGPLEDMAVGPLGDVVISSGNTASREGFELTTRQPSGAWRTEPIDVNLRAGRVLVNGAGDALALSSADASNTQEQVYVSTLDAPAERPAIRTFRAVGAGGRAEGIRLRIALSAAGRVLLSLTGPGGRTTLGAAMVAVGRRGVEIPLPNRMAAAMRRGGAYRLSADTGARAVSRGYRAIAVGVRSAR